VRLIGLRIQSVFLGESEGDIKQHELIGMGESCAKAEKEK
jgi:hypothetical protein